VPASSSSPVARIAAHRAPVGDLVSVRPTGLWACLAGVADPRDRRGLRHDLAGLLAVAVCAVLAGARSFVAIGEWAADAPPRVLSALGIRTDPLTGIVRPPDEATVRRVLTSIDGDALDTAIGAWLADTPTPHPSAQPAGAHVPWRAVAVDGKTLRGSGPPGDQVHLLAALDHASGAVFGQVAVDGKSNEITAFQPLLAGIDLTRTVVTADAMHTRREHAEFLVDVKHAGYIFIVKRNQPNLYRQLRSLPWRRVPTLDETHDRGHGRYEIRRLQALTSNRLPFPHAVQAIRLTRRVHHHKAGTWTTVTI
jgi:predicted transposase YbfD/YdcC